MVKLERGSAAVITTQHAAATCLGHEDRLPPAPPIGDRELITIHAGIVRGVPDGKHEHLFVYQFRHPP
jgi:hypothetical protein